MTTCNYLLAPKSDVQPPRFGRAGGSGLSLGSLIPLNLLARFPKSCTMRDWALESTSGSPTLIEEIAA
jgi:hypothetical protein